MSTARLILTTIGSLDEAAKLGHILVDERLAACVNIIERVHSIYRWQGGVKRDDEVLLIVKTTASRSDALRSRLIAEHPYDLPELVELDPAYVSEDYASWLDAETRAGD